MPRVELPELHEKRDGEMQAYKLVNQIKRRFNLVGQRGTSFATATTLEPPGDGDYYHVTGSAPVDFIDLASLADGDALELYFVDGTTLDHGSVTPPEGTYPLRLAGAVNAVLAAGAKIRLRRDDVLAVMVEMWRGAP